MLLAYYDNIIFNIIKSKKTLFLSASTISCMVRKQLSLLTCNILLLPHGAPGDICNKLEVIIDYGSVFVIYGKITE